MDKRIRRNEICSIGLPRCDFVFSSTRSCFIAYSFDESALEMTIIRNILEKHGIQAIEAGKYISPGQSTFCTKICSKIITSQFCIVLLNNKEENGVKVQSANVNMEYGMILGFNKYVIPFQRETEELPFNVAGLDTVKYTNRSLEEKADEAIKHAITATQQDEVPLDLSDQHINSFLLKRNLLLSPIDNEGEKNIYLLGKQVGFSLLVNFSGMEYTYLGNFSTLKSNVIIWRIKKLDEILIKRASSIPKRAILPIVANTTNVLQMGIAQKLLNLAKILVIVTSEKEKVLIKEMVSRNNINHDTEIISIEQIDKELSNLF